MFEVVIGALYGVIFWLLWKIWRVLRKILVEAEATNDHLSFAEDHRRVDR